MKEDLSSQYTLRSRVTAEIFGTFCLVFTGTGAIVINDVSNGVVTHLGIALTFGLIIVAMIYSLGEISGAHLNPAVTIAFVAARRFPKSMALPYIAAQCTGAFSASFLLKVLFPQHRTLGATLPSGPVVQSFALEFFLTLILMFVILQISSGAKEKGITAGIAVGAVVGLEALFAGPISGASMNPARSIAPALVSGQMKSLWIYLLGPTLGSLSAVILNQLIKKKRMKLETLEDAQDGSKLHL